MTPNLTPNLSPKRSPATSDGAPQEHLQRRFIGVVVASALVYFVALLIPVHSSLPSDVLPSAVAPPTQSEDWKVPLPPPRILAGLSPLVSSDNQAIEISDLPAPGKPVGIVGGDYAAAPGPAAPEWAPRGSATSRQAMPVETPAAEVSPLDSLPSYTSAPTEIKADPNSYTEGDTALETWTVLADAMSIYQEPHFESPTMAAGLRKGDKVRVAARLVSDTGFDWLKVLAVDRFGWVPAEYCIRTPESGGTAYSGETLPLGRERVDRSSAVPFDYKPKDLRQLPTKWCYMGREVYVRAATLEALSLLLLEGEKAGLQLRVLSGYRPFEQQRLLYLEALKKDGPKQDGVAPPGYSEHHLGTTVDFCGPDPKSLLNRSFGTTAEGLWLKANAPRYGLRNSYTDENSEDSGYKPEPWHWRHMGAFGTP